MTDVKKAVEQLLPQAGADNAGGRIGFLDSATKAAQNDTVTITNASYVTHVALTIDASGVAEPTTISGNTITLTSATTGAVSGIVIYK